jgi:hypothetical protein
VSPAADITVHRFPAEQQGAFVNAYLVETAAGVVAVDSLHGLGQHRDASRA